MGDMWFRDGPKDPNNKAKLVVQGVQNALDVIDHLKLNNNGIFTIDFDAPRSGDMPLEQAKKVVDGLEDILRTKCIIESLTLQSFRPRDTNREARAYFFKKVASGRAGENLEHLWLKAREEMVLSMVEVEHLEKYLRRNRVTGACTINVHCYCRGSLASHVLGLTAAYLATKWTLTVSRLHAMCQPNLLTYSWF